MPAGSNNLTLESASQAPACVGQDRGVSLISRARGGGVVPLRSRPAMPTLVTAESLTSRARQISAICAVLAVLGLAFAREGPQRDGLAAVALVAIGLASALGWIELLVVRRPRRRGPNRPVSWNSRQWLLAAIAVVVMAGLAVQTWFRAGTTIATGDIKTPDGIAWLGRLFEPWAWTGSNLGEPSQLALALPWAAVLGTVHALGGNPELAQRIWYSTLF